MIGRVLIVDDDENVRLVVEKWLVHEGYTCMALEGGEHAVEAIREWGPDVVLLDLLMPDVSGAEVLGRMRLDAAVSQIPVLVLSALDDEESRVQGLRLGALDYLTKPFSLRELSMRLSKLVQIRQVLGERVSELSTRADPPRFESEMTAEDVVEAPPASAVDHDSHDSGRVRVLVADDHALFRSALGWVLAQDPGIQVVGEAAGGEEAVILARKLKPDVVLMDLKMPGLSGLEATRQILQEQPAAHVLVLSAFQFDRYILQASKAGASAFLPKDSVPEVILSSIRSAAGGEPVGTSEVASQVFEMMRSGGSLKEFYDGLTSREVEVVGLVAGGLRNHQIASRLSISEVTVRKHLSSAFRKLNILDRNEAVLYGIRKGLVEVETA